MLLKSEEMNSLFENKVKKEATQRSYVVIPTIFKACGSLLITSIKTIYRLKELFSKKFATFSFSMSLKKSNSYFILKSYYKNKYDKTFIDRIFA